MKEIALAARVRIADDVVFRDLQAEMAILHLGTGLYFGLDRVATRIWHLLAERPTLGSVLEALLDEYDVPEARCRQDLLEFVAELRGHDLVSLEG